MAPFAAPRRRESVVIPQCRRTCRYCGHCVLLPCETTVPRYTYHSISIPCAERASNESVVYYIRAPPGVETERDLKRDGGTATAAAGAADPRPSRDATRSKLGCSRGRRATVTCPHRDRTPHPLCQLPSPLGSSGLAPVKLFIWGHRCLDLLAPDDMLAKVGVSENAFFHPISFLVAVIRSREARPWTV